MTAILGAGMMGTAIAAAHLRCGLPVALCDSVPAALLNAKKYLNENKLITFSENLADALQCPVLIETITEKLKAKQKLYKNIVNVFTEEKPGRSRHVPLVFSNTSTISITSLAAGLPPDWQRNFCGFHFFHPVRENPVIEIIAGKETAPETAEFAVQYARQLNKQPICVGDGPGFLVNRILNGYLSAALQLLEGGESVERIDNAAVHFGMRMGPFRIMDEIGLDVVFHSGWVLHKAFPDRVPQSQTLVRLVEQGRLGSKTGSGFRNNSEFQITNYESQLTEDEIVRRLTAPMFDEARRCVADGIINSIAVAEFAMVNALGFPTRECMLSNFD
ncbi:MAG: 3-hydroxyacyl-CoA dehydrogenase family protein [Planctomycetaceae bacterium]|jgi:3-hydroxyacyl-CoA dehydrogenase|nr:3-hydroxyacyl-CoA dehydrogenase family protein [Planctomycetaceae bacterium]